MPPKQKDVKKGPSYKASIPFKDIVPNDIKEPPRQPKSFKIPESFAETLKNSENLPALFEEWPTQQTLRVFDFGINSEVKFVDPFHQQIENYFHKQVASQWKCMNQIEYDEGDDGLQNNQVFHNSKNQIESFKNIGNNSQDSSDKPICVIQTFMRPQNQEEMKNRLKEQAQKAQKAAKQKKKGNKKEEPKQEGPIQVSDVQMSDIITLRYMQKSAIWIGSQLQIIKQRNLKDVNNNEPVWKKIYPQENGVPQITKSGKYWVKLLYMGRYIKVEVDDRIPINQKKRELFPISTKYNQKWTLIITKALIKYLNKASNDVIIGNGLVVYALTGLISETVSLSQFKQWQKLSDLLSNEHYQKKDIFLGCFSLNDSKSFQKLTHVKVQQEQIKEGEDDEQFIDKEVDTNILNGYSYCIGDYFDTEGFNMVFSQEKTQKQMLLKHELNELCKISITNKSREQKLEYRRKKKELKQKLGLQQKKRMQLISKAPIHYHFLKLLADLNIDCEYGQKQILLAKKCILNKLSQPPNYDFPIQKQEKDTKSLQSISISVGKYKQQSELFPNIHDFSSIPNITELLARKDNGIWIKDIDLLQFFQQIQILYNPNIFNSKKIENVESKRTNSFSYDQNKEILVVQKSQQDNEQQKRVRLLFGFAYQRSINDGYTPYTILQKFNFDSFRATSNVVTLNQDISSKLINLKNQNSVFKLYTMSKGNYNYWISSDSAYKLLSISDYLIEYQGYTKKNLNFEYPPIEANTYFPLIRLKLKQQGDQSNTVLLKLVNARQQLLANLNYRIVTIPSQQRPLTSQQEQGIILRNNQNTLLTYEYNRFTIQPNFQYYLIIEAHSDQNIPDGSLQIMLLAKEQGLNIDQTEQVEPVKIIQKYMPNKYGLICRERIFTNNDSNSTITVKLGQFQQVQAVEKGKAAKKGGKDEAATQLIEKPFAGSRSIILQILNGQKILYQASGINEITVPNFKFASTKPPTTLEYYLQLKFDLRVWPQAASKSSQTDKICWITQIFSQETLAFVRDTQQEDREKKTRKQWEDKEPGRAERAKKARRRFLIEMKKENGESLTQEQEQLINAPRLTKKQQLEQEKKNQEKKGKGGKKDDKKAGKDAKKEEVLDQKPVQRQPPKSQDHFMNEVKQFLQILQNCVVRYDSLEDGEPRIRSAQQIRSIKEGAIMSIENRVGRLIRNIQKRQTIKIYDRQRKQSITSFLSQVKSQVKQKYSSYVQWRNQDIQKDRARQDKQRLLIDIINQEKPTITEIQLKKNIAEYKDINGYNSYLAEVADMVRKNIRIANLTQKISTLLTNWEIEQLKNVREEIKNDKIEGINDQVLRQMKETLQEVDKNPGIVAEKQAEAKKAKKGGKK